MICHITEGEPLPHSWRNATCTDPKQCNLCGELEGEELGHDWQDATCMMPKMCKRCGRSEGDVGEHTWNDATCTSPKICIYCHHTEGLPLGHTWSEEWSSDESGHWHGTLCGHDLKQDMEGHDTVGNGGSCSVCGYDSNDIGRVLTSAYSHSALISGGSITSADDYATRQITYEFGSGYTHIINSEMNGNILVGRREYWNYISSFNGDERIYSLLGYTSTGTSESETAQVDHGTRHNTDATMSDMKGYMFSLDPILGYGLADAAYGVEEFALALYNFANGDSDALVGECDMGYDGESGEYYFSFKCMTGNSENGIYREIRVSFKLSDQGAVASMNVSGNVYYDPVAADAGDTSGADYTVAEDGTVVLLGTAMADATVSYSIMQNVGERSASPAHNIDELVADTVTVSDGEGNAIDSTTVVTAGETVQWSIDITLPDSASLIYDSPSFIVDINGERAEWFNIDVDSADGKISFTPALSGDYVIEMHMLRAQYTIEFSVELPEVEAIAPVVDGIECTSVAITEGYGFEFKAKATNNSYADASFFASCIRGGLRVSETDSSAYLYMPNGAGSDTITLVSTVKSGVCTSLSVSIMTPAQIINGTWGGYCLEADGNADHMVYATFTPGSSGALSGTVEIEDTKYNYLTERESTYTATYSYTYDSQSGRISLTYKSGTRMSFGFEINGFAGIDLVYGEDNSQMVAYSDSSDADVEGSWSYTYYDKNKNDDGEYDEYAIELVIWSDNVAELTITETDEDIYCIWTKSGDIYLLSDEYGDVGSVSIDDYGNAVIKINNMGEYTLESTWW